MRSAPQPSNDALTSWIAESVISLGAREEFGVRREESNEFLLLFGPCARTIRYADAYLTLEKAGFSSEGIPLARAALEHAVTVQWVYLRAGGIERFRVETAHGHKEHYDNLATWLNHSELAAEVAKIPSPPKGKRMPKFMAMLRDLDKERFMETSYHILSQQVHVSHSAVLSFLEWDEEGYQVKYDQTNPHEYQTAYITAVACMLVRWVIAKLTNNADELAYLDKKSDELMIPMTLEDGIPESKRRGR
jgi:hypothetical protein